MTTWCQPDASESILRFRDLVNERFGVLPAGLTGRWYKALAVEQAAQAEAKRRAVKTLPEWEAARRQLREDYPRALGPFPSAEVAVREAGLIERPDFTVRKMLFSAFQGDWVPANLYLPRSRQGLLPAVVLPCGHGVGGKSDYAPRAVSLARNGYAALTFDLIGTGERQLTPAESGAVYPASTQHNILGEAMTLAGCTLGWFFIQETLAAVTVLSGLPEVDPGRIGITGSSGGGWLSVHAAALDERIGVVVPAASVCSFRHEPQADDAEQVLFDMQRLGLHHPDLMGLLICPRPLFIVANSRDIWGVAGTEYARQEAARFYALHGHPERLRMQVWDKGHVYDPDQWLQAVRWLDQWLKPGAHEADPIPTDSEPPLTFQDLAVTASGRLDAEGYAAPGRLFAAFARAALTPAPDLEGFLACLRAETAPDRPVAWGRLDRFVAGPAFGQRVWLAPHQGLLLPADIFAPPLASGVTILLDEGGRRHALDWAMAAVARGCVAVCPDLRGWGELEAPEDWADWEGWARNRYDSRRRAPHALARLTGRRLPFDRATDILALLDVVEQLAPGLPVTVRARRQATIPALLAGLADPRIGRLILERGLASYQDILDTDLPLWNAEGFIHGLLGWGLDLPDLRAAFRGELAIREPLDGLMRPKAAASGKTWRHAPAHIVPCHATVQHEGPQPP